MMNLPRHDAILLLGPTGAGKTPLGEALANSSRMSKSCFHFDFGANLRRIAGGKVSSGKFDIIDLKVIQEVLTQGKLLENESFYIARKILEAFIVERSVAPQDVLILNGLPRHLGQAMDTDKLVSICAIVSLECTPSVVLARIQQNTGGDRTNRTDDSLAEIQAKLQIFQERTQPLRQYYESKGVPVYQVNVGVNSTPVQMVDMVLMELNALDGSG